MNALLLSTSTRQVHRTSLALITMLIGRQQTRSLSPIPQRYRPHLSRVPRLPVSTPLGSSLQLHAVMDQLSYGTLIREVQSGGVRVM